MSREFPRSQRVADQIQRDLADLIQREIQDPRLRLVTVSAVEVSRDLAHAKVFVTCMDAQQDHNQVLQALEHAAGFLRHHLGHRLTTRVVPDLHFVYDTSIAEGSRLSKLIDDAVAADAKHDADD